MQVFEGMTEDEAREFTVRWLPAWTGNDPELLLSFYADDATYLDPAVPDGIHGRAALRAYFTRLLARYPDWEWTHRRSDPLPDGFVNHWHARVPTADGGVVEFDGICLVVLRAGSIVRNEVFFDRLLLAGT